MRTRRIITVPPRPPPTDDATARGSRPLQLLDAADLPWIDELIDAVANLAGQPWRVALDAIEGGTWQRPSEDRIAAPHDISPRRHEAPAAAPAARNTSPRRLDDQASARNISPRRLNAATSALRRLLSGRPHDANLARNARSLLLGVPALDDAARAARIAAVATQLAVTPATLERVLWADVPRERPIELTRGRPSASEVAALANVGLLQRALARAHSLELVIRGDAGPLLRGAAARGLLVAAYARARTSASTPAPVRIVDAAAPTPTPKRTVDAAAPTPTPVRTVDAAAPTPTPVRTVDATAPAPAYSDDAVSAERETMLEIVGPLALCHGTAVYGRALGNLVPLLATCETFALTIHVEAHGQMHELRVDSPALLPASAPRRWALVERLADDLERVGAPHGVRVRRSPPALAHPTHAYAPPRTHPCALACPDLGLELRDRLIWIEVVGFWTPEYLAHKLARYRALGAAEVVLCVDSTRTCDDDTPPPGAIVMRFERRVHAEPLLQLLGIARAG